MAADVVVVNHHLFFADLNVRESGVAELLPSVNTIIFDEAHQLNDIGVHFFGDRLTTAQLDGFRRDFTLQGLQWARGLANWHLIALDIERSIGVLRSVCGPGTERRRWIAEGPEGISQSAWVGAMSGLVQVLKEAELALRTVMDASPNLTALHARVVDLLEKIDRFFQPLPAGIIRWLETGKQIKLMHTPLDIADVMRSLVTGCHMASKLCRSWIFTSATLGVADDMGWFLESCGLTGAHLLQVESPFNYAVQAALYVPDLMPKPSDPSHSVRVAMLVADAAEVLGGRTLLLTTSLRAMKSIGDALQHYFSQSNDIVVLVQGQLPKRELLERFGQPGAVGCILVASSSFWEGVDIPGDALQMVVIDKLPFASPNNLLVEAKAKHMAAHGKNAFKMLHLPQAAIALRQGVGRLIRRETDRGVLVVCDVRLVNMPYGHQLLASLPAMKVIENQEQFHDALHILTRPSTTDPDSS